MRWGLVWVVVLAAATGCSTFGAGVTGTPTPEMTPAPVPTGTRTATPKPTPSVAPGVSTTGIVDVDRLVDSHVRVLRNTSWVWHETSSVTRSYGNATLTLSSDRTVWFAGPRSYLYEASWTDTRYGGEEEYALFVDGDVAYRHGFSPEKGREVFRRDETAFPGRDFPGFAAGPIRVYLSLDSAVISRVDVGTHKHYRVEGSRTLQSEGENVTVRHVRAVVRADGFVRQLNVTYSSRAPNRTVEGRYAFAYRRVGNATVERPTWVEARFNESAP